MYKRQHKVRFAAGDIDLIDDRSPDQPLRRIGRRTRFTLDAHHGAHHRSHRRPVAPEQDHCRRAVAGNVGARGVNDVAEVDARQEILDQLLACLLYTSRCV